MSSLFCFRSAKLAIINKGEVFTATEGDEQVELRCLASSLVTPTLSWERNGDPLQPTGSVVSDDDKVVTSSLVLKDVTTEDAGQYVCLARNGPKSVETQLRLIVNGEYRLGAQFTWSTACYF